MKSLKIAALLIISVFTCITSANAQERDLQKIADSISTEADLLYKSEWASWYGTDIFLEKCKAMRPMSGGYISYDTGKGLKNVFFSKDPEPKTLAIISFGYDYNAENYTLDTVQRLLNKQEKELYTIRQAVIADIGKDTLYKHYKNSNLNPIPIITKKEKKVYVLTGPQVTGVIIFGNDYLITFDNKNNITDKKTLHKNIIPINYNKPGPDPSKDEETSFHIHRPETGEFMTATDICTLRLYEKNTTWKTSMVRSKDYVSIWDCQKDKLFIMTAEALKKIAEHKN